MSTPEMTATPLRLMQVMAGGSVGGAEAFFERMVLALGRAGIVQHIAVRRHPTRVAHLRASGAEISQHPFGGALDFRTRRRLRREAKRFRPDIVLAWMSRAAAMAPQQPGVLMARLGGYYNLKYYRNCDHLIGNTRDICDYLVRQGWPEDRTHYLPNFVDAEPAPPEDRALHDTPANAPLLLSLGRLHWRKGFDVLLSALRAVPGAFLWIAGAGPAEPELRRCAAELGVADRVRWLGWRQDVGALYRACDVFVCPSRQEPLGNVVIEAWAHGAPVVATHSAGPTALIGTGETGILVPPEDADSLACAIRTVLSAPAQAAAMREAGRAAYEGEFTEAAVVGRYLEFFERVRA
jgi:glycosyltransferase involved in cell wall biosynthesis